MDKMNQVSVTEFMSKSKEEMYDMAVEMVEKYNRLVDICNDSAERMADLIERHTAYTNALNKDIADKAAKIDLLEKEIEGRKEGYYALKTQMDVALANKNEKIDKLNEQVSSLTEHFSAKSVELEGYKERDEKAKELINNSTKEISELKKELEKAHDRIDAENRMYKMLYAEYEKLEKRKGEKKEDDHGRAGFKKYIEYLIEEEERAVPERFKARLNEEIETIFTKEEETEVKGVKEPIIFDEYHKYNWFPCGEDSIE